MIRKGDSRYDLVTMTITADQLTQYQRDGYLVLENFVPAAKCDRLRERAEQLVKDFDPAEAISIFTTHEQSRVTDDYFLDSGDKIRFFFEENAFLPDGSLRQQKEKSINKIGHALHDLDPAFQTFSRTPELKDLARALEVENPLLLQSMYIYKQPNIGGEVICHQDCTFIFTEPMSMAGLWFALEDATVENGCLWAIPGGHELGLKSRWVRAPEGGMRFDVFDESPWPEERLIPLEVTKGTLIVLHGLLPHKSLENKSPKSRQAYTLHLIGGNSSYPADNWLQRSVDLPLRGF
jgi:phytanoyl-CoA hydroxylase